MKEGRLVLITGGARSGKSTFAEKLALESGKPVIYLATSQVFDEEMAERVERHRNRRPHHWRTIEEPYQVAEVFATEGKDGFFILLDCLTLLASNWVLRELGRIPQEEDQVPPGVEEKVGIYLKKVVEAARACPAEVALVTNEVGWGVVPSNPLGRVYRDIVGRMNQHAASISDQVFMVVAGIPMRLKG